MEPLGKVLVVDDEVPLAKVVASYLEREGFAVDLAHDGPSAVEQARSLRPDLIVLDLMLPGFDGVEACRQIRTFTDAYVIMLTARDDELDIVTGLDTGAVDYITKPFKLAELLARIRAQLRRTDHPRVAERIVLGDLVVDINAHRVFIDGTEVAMRAKEFDLLTRLAGDAGHTVSREQLMADVWDEHWFGSTKTLEVHISSLRRRLGEGPGEPSRITALRGVGYRWERDA